MCLHRKLIVTALAAATLFASIATSAPARNFSVTNRNIRVQFEPVKFNESHGQMSCRVTLEGSFHCATISKVIGALIGFISRATSDFCRNTGFQSAMAFKQETLPWHISYEGFRGRLPAAIVMLLLSNVGVTVQFPIFGPCPYSANFEMFMSGPAGGGVNEGNAMLRPDESRAYRSARPECPDIVFATNPPEPITLLGTTIGIRVRLT
jgi:hypothetical protein